MSQNRIFLFSFSPFFTNFDTRRVKLVQFRIGGVGDEKERGDLCAGQERLARREGLLARLRWNAYELEECAWKVSGG